MYKSPLCVCTAFCGACTRRHLGVNVKGAAVCIITSLCVYGVVVCVYKAALCANAKASLCVDGVSVCIRRRCV